MLIFLCVIFLVLLKNMNLSLRTDGITLLKYAYLIMYLSYFRRCPFYTLKYCFHFSIETFQEKATHALLDDIK